MPRRRRAGINIAGTISVGISRAGIVRRRSAGSVSGSRICGCRSLCAVILRDWLIRPLLGLVLPLLILVRLLLRLIRPLLILIRSLLILIRPSLRLVLPLLIPVLPLILRSVRPGLKLRITELPERWTAFIAALPGRRNHGQTEEQDRCGYRRRMLSFRV